MKCINCNAELKEGSRFCVNCGAQVQYQAEQTPEPTAVEQQAPVVEQPAAEFAPQYSQPAPEQQPVAEFTPQYSQPAPEQQPVAEFTPQYSQPAPEQQPQQFAPQYEQPVAPEQQPQQFAPQYGQPAPEQQPQQFAPQYGQPAPEQQPQQFAPQYGQPAQPQYAPPQYQARVKEKKPLSKKAKVFIIGGSAVALLAIAALVVFLVISSKPVNKIKSAIGKTFEVEGFLDKIDISDIVEDGEYSSNMTLKAKFGSTVDEVFDLDSRMFDSSTINISFATDDNKVRFDLSNDDILKKNIGLSFYMDGDQMMLGVPGLTSKVIGFNYNNLSYGYLADEMGYDVMQTVGQLLTYVTASETRESTEKLGEDILDVFWDVLSECEIESIDKDRLSDTESDGYTIKITSMDLLNLIKKVVPILREYIPESGMESAVNSILAYSDNKDSFDYNSFLDDLLVDAEKELGFMDPYEDPLVITMTIASGAIGRFYATCAGSTLASATVTGGDYPLQNFNFNFGNILVISSTGSSDKDGSERGKFRFGDSWDTYDIVWTSDKDGRFSISFGDTSDNYGDIGNLRSSDLTDIDGIEIRGTVDKSSSEMNLSISKFALYTDGAEMIEFSGDVNVSGDATVSRLDTTEYFDIGAASEMDFENFVEELSTSVMTELLGVSTDYLSDLYGLYNYNYLDGDGYDNYYYDDYGYYDDDEYEAILDGLDELYDLW